jgi:glutamate-1-semialdehyde 2,1-aminomutase
MERGEGAYVYDVDGNRHIDFWNSHGATMLGHGSPPIVAAVQDVLERGILCSAETDIQVEVAEELIRMFPGMEMVRYANSGTETT